VGEVSLGRLQEPPVGTREAVVLAAGKVAWVAV